MPASCANAFAPTIALLGGTDTPTIDDSALLVGTSACVWMPVECGSVGAHFERHHEFFERRVPARSPMPLIVHSTWRAPACTCGQRVRDGKSQIVVAVRGQDRTVADALSDRGEHTLDIGRQRIADSIGKVDRRRAGVHRRFSDIAEEIEVASRRVFSGKLDVIAVGACMRDGRRDLRQALRARDAQLVFEVNVRRRKKHVNARPRRLRQRRPGAIDVRRNGAGQAGNDRPPHGPGNRAHGLEVSVR